MNCPCIINILKEANLINIDMYLSVCGFNHRTANLQDREPFQISRADLADVTAEYMKFTGAEEAAVVATCNRVEFFRVVKQKNNHCEELIRFYQHRGIKNSAALRDICYSRQGTTAARHLFRVASGLDSLVLGEDQIFHQVKQAYSSACAVGGPGQILHKVFHLSFQVAKRVRNETNIAAGPRNVPGAAMELLNNRMDGKSLENAVIIGVNNLSEIFLETLTNKNVHCTLANRTPYHAQKMAGGYGADFASLEDIPGLLQNAGAVFTMASAPEHLIEPEHIIDKDRQLYIVDIAVPRNVNPEVNILEEVTLLDLQDLKRHLDVTANKRSDDIPAAEEMIEQQVGNYSMWRTKTLGQEKLLKLKEALNHTRVHELEKVRISFRKSDLKALDAFSSSIMREFLRLTPYLMDDDETPLEGMDFGDERQ